MPEFRREIGGANLGNIPGVRAVKPRDSGAATAKIASTLLQTGLEVGGRAAARSAGERIAGEGESDVDVDKAVGDAGDAILFEEGFAESEGKDLTGPELEDLKRATFDSTLTTAKRIKRAHATGQMSKTNADARIANLRNAALSNPFIAMFQGELDQQLFPGMGSGKTSTGGLTARPDELQAAETAKAERKAIAEFEASVATAAKQLNVSPDVARKRLTDVARQQSVIEQLDRDKKIGAYNSKSAARRANMNIPGLVDITGSILNTFSEEGGGDIAEARVAIEDAYNGTLKQITQHSKDNKGNVVMLGEDLDKLMARASKIKEGALASLENRSELTALLDKVKKTESVNKNADLEITNRFREQFPGLLALNDSPILQQAAMDAIMGKNEKQLRALVSTNPTVKFLMDERDLKRDGELVVGAANSMRDPSQTPTGDESKAWAAISTGASTAELWNKSSEEDRGKLSEKIRNTPYTASQLFNDKSWNGPSLNSAINGVVSRARSKQAIQKDEVDYLSVEGVKQGLTDLATAMTTPFTSVGDISPTSGKLSGLPESIKIELIGESQYKISTGGVEVSPEFKSAAYNLKKIGMTRPDIIPEAFTNEEGQKDVDAWINSMFSRSAANRPSAFAREQGVGKKEPFSLISNAGASELDPSEVDAGFPKEEENVDISGGLFKGTAVHDLQKEIGVDEDGIVGPNTKRMARAKLGKEEGDRLIKEAEAAQVEQFEEITDDLSTRVAEKIGKHIEPEWVQAIWMHESDKGNKVLGGTYNLGNIKAKKGEASVTKKVWEVIDGKDVMVDSKFRKFDNFEEASEAWADFLDTPRYAKAREAVTFKEFTSELKKAGYATDPKWEKGVHANVKENSRDSESAKGLIGDLDKIEKEREVLKLMAKFKNLTFQEMVDEGIIDKTLEQGLF